MEWSVYAPAGNAIIFACLVGSSDEVILWKGEWGNPFREQGIAQMKECGQDFSICSIKQKLSLHITYFKTMYCLLSNNYFRSCELTSFTFVSNKSCSSVIEQELSGF